MEQLSIPSRTLDAAARGLSRARPSAAAALQAALVAGTVVLLVLQFIGIVAYDESPWKLPRMVAAMARGPAALEPDDEFDFAIVAIGLTLYSVNFHGFTVIFAWFAANRTIDTLIAHAIYGFLLARAYCAFRGE